MQEVKNFIERLAAERNLSKHTLRAYRGDLQDLAGRFPSQPLERLSTEDLRGYLHHLQERRLKASTIRRRLATIRVFYNSLEADGRLAAAPTRQLRHRYIIEKRLPRVMPIGHVESMLAAAHRRARPYNGSGPHKRARALRDVMMLELLFATGMRSGELVALDVTDIDLDRATALLRGKGRREREVYISSQEVLAGVREYLASRLTLMPQSEALVVNSRGQRLHVQSVGAIFRNIRTVARVAAQHTPHCLRHTMATLLVENGADVRAAQEILGHSSIRTTEIYVTVSRTRQQAVMSRFNARDRMKIRRDQ